MQLDQSLHAACFGVTFTALGAGAPKAGEFLPLQLPGRSNTALEERSYRRMVAKAQCKLESRVCSHVTNCIAKAVMVNVMALGLWISAERRRLIGLPISK